MKKILIIVQQREDGAYPYGHLIQEYIDMKKSQGYSVELIADTTGVMKSLLEEEELWGKEITSAQAEVMFEINRYELVIYLPQDAVSLKDAPVYDPNKLDKNMIFYNIGNMIIVNSPSSQKKDGWFDKPLPHSVSDIPSDEVHAADQEQSMSEELKSSEVINGESFLQDENEMSASCSECSESQSAFLEEQSAESQEEIPEESVAPSERAEDGEISEDPYSENPSEEGASQEAEQQDPIEEKSDDGLFVSEESGIDSSEQTVHRENSGEGTAWESISAHSVLSISENGTDIIPQVSEKHRRENETKQFSYEDTVSSEPEKVENLPENIALEEMPRKLSVVRKLWLICPWILMGLMALLKYKNVAWIPFIVSIIGFFAAVISKKSRKQSKTPEWLSVFLALIALIVNFAHAEWMMVIALPISIMATVLFIIAGFVDWDN